MNVDAEDSEFLAAIERRPQDDAIKLVYADWLEERGDPRAEYLRLQVEYRKSRSDAAKRRLIELYPHRHLRWTTRLEQAGAIDANLTKWEFAWWGSGIGPARESASTYQRYRYHDQPPLPAESFDGSFAWLRASESLGKFRHADDWRDFLQEKKAQGYFVPAEVETFLGGDDLPGRIKSCTDNYFLPPPKGRRDGGAGLALETNDGLLTSFYVDSQYCLIWAILLPREPGRYTPIVAGPPRDVFPGQLDDDDPVDKPVVVASQFEAFLFRCWIENEIWFATQWEETRRPLLPWEQAYVDHFK